MPIVFIGFVSADAESACTGFEVTGCYGAVAFSVDIEGDVSVDGVAYDGDVLPLPAFKGSVGGTVVVSADEVVVIEARLSGYLRILDACVECDATSAGIVFLGDDDLVAEVVAVLTLS